MKVIIYDYAGRRKEIQLSKPIQNAFMLIVTGDQLLYVKYTDGTQQMFDSCDDYRDMNFLDNGFFVELQDGKDFIEEHKNMY